MKTADTLIGIVLVGFAVAVFLASGAFSGQAVQVYGPEMFPRAISVLLALCAVGLIVQARAGRVRALDEPPGVRGLAKVAAAVGLCLAYIQIMPILGFPIATPVFLACLIWFLGLRRTLPVLGIAIAIAAVAWVLFTQLLLVPLPEGGLFLR